MKLVQAILKRSEHPAYVWMVFVLTACESVFLFIPPEVFMAPPIIANRRRAIPITLAAAAGSFLGGAIAYMIGYWLFDTVGVFLINTFATMDKFEMVRQMFLAHGAVIIMLSAVTPIPYKLMSICAGFLGFPLWLFLLVSGIFRTGRFTIIATLLYFFQARARKIIEQYFWPLTIGAIGAAGLGVGLMLLL